MKLRKLLMCLLAALVLCGVPAVNTMAAETEAAAAGTEEELNDNEAADAAEEAVEETEDEAEPEADEDEEEAEETVKAADKKAAAKAAVEKKEEKLSYTKSELRLLSALIFCEAGSEPYAGKLAVGIVVMNRKESRSFPGTIKDVIYQKYQFGPARNGSLKKALASYDAGKFTSANEKACIKAAKEALSGEKQVTYKGKDLSLKGYLYFSGRVSGARLQIGNHQFK